MWVILLLLEPVMNSLLTTIQFPASSADVSPAPSHQAPAEEVTQLMNYQHQGAVLAEPELSTQLGHQQTALGEPESISEISTYICAVGQLYSGLCPATFWGCAGTLSPGCWGSVPSWLCPHDFGARCCWGSCPAAEAGMYSPLLWSMEWRQLCNCQSLNSLSCLLNVYKGDYLKSAQFSGSNSCFLKPQPFPKWSSFVKYFIKIQHRRVFAQRHIANVSLSLCWARLPKTFHSLILSSFTITWAILKHDMISFPEFNFWSFRTIHSCKFLFKILLLQIFCKLLAEPATQRISHLLV